MEKINVPNSVRVITGEQSKVQGTINDFFRNVYDTLVDKLEIPDEKKIDSPVSDFEIKIQGLYKSEPGSPPTDSKVHMLKYKESVVACVMETRTGFNWVQYDFFANIEDLI